MSWAQSMNGGHSQPIFDGTVLYEWAYVTDAGVDYIINDKGNGNMGEIVPIVDGQPDMGNATMLSGFRMADFDDVPVVGSYTPSTSNAGDQGGDQGGDQW